MARLQAGTPLPSLALAGQRLRLAILLTFVILVGELLGGYFANSLALLADAGHIFADLFALSLSLFAVRQMQRPSDRYMTFGYHRVGVLVALINALTLLAITGAIFWGAANRFRDPPDVEGGLTLGVAAIGLAVNGVVMGLLWQHRATSLNVPPFPQHQVSFPENLGSLSLSPGILAKTSLGSDSTSSFLANKHRS